MEDSLLFLNYIKHDPHLGSLHRLIPSPVVYSSFPISSKLNVTFSMRPILEAHLKLHVYLPPQTQMEKGHEETFWGYANVPYKDMCYRSIYM